MKILFRRALPVTLLAALFFSGCAGLPAVKPPAPAVHAKGGTPKKIKAAAPALKNTRPLFVIERNTNTNVVHYEASLAPDGSLTPAEPVTVYWLMLAEDGRRKKLSWLEKKKAYGIKIKPAPGLNGYTLTLAAAPWLPIAVRSTDGTVRAEAPINGRPAVLEKMFIQAHGGLLGPKVDYIELFGKDLGTGAACREKLLPK